MHFAKWSGYGFTLQGIDWVNYYIVWAQTVCWPGASVREVAWHLSLGTLLLICQNVQKHSFIFCIFTTYTFYALQT